MVQIASPSASQARLALCSRSEIPGAVDGAWWPHSSDLRAELPDLVAVLGMSIGPVRRVVYDPSIWPAAPSRIIRGTALTTVDAYTLVANDTIYLMGTHSRSAVLFVVPPAVPVDAVRRVLRAVTNTTGSMSVAVLRHLVDRFARGTDQSPTS
ncbi:MAG: DUF5994 family protein [Mycobacterium sp.]